MRFYGLSLYAAFPGYVADIERRCMGKTDSLKKTQEQGIAVEFADEGGLTGPPGAEKEETSRRRSQISGYYLHFATHYGIIMHILACIAGIKK